MDNKSKRSSIRKDFLKNFKEKDYFSCYENAENIIKLYNREEKESFEYCTDLYNLAYIQQNLGKYSMAIKYYKKILKILDKEPYETDTKEGIEIIKFIVDTENSLGICYFKSTLKQRFSIKCFERALFMAKKYLKDKEETLVNILHNMGSSYYDLQQYEDAIYHFLEELSYRKNKDIDFVDNLNFLGYSYQELKKYDEAIGYFNQALDIIKGLFGINSDEYMTNKYYISSIYSKMGNYDLAIKSYEKACTLIEQKLGNKHPYLAEALSKLAENYLKIDKPHDALKIQLKSLNIVKETVGEKHMFYASALKRVGDIYYILEDFQKCLTYYETENKIKENVIGMYNEEYVTSLLNLINIFVKTNNTQKEEQAKDKLLKMVDFDLPKKSYERALLILCKIYICNNLPSNLYDIYEHYKYVNDIDSFDDMVKKSKDIDEDIINKDKKLNAIFNNYEEEAYEEDDDIKEDIFDGIKNLFDGLKSEIDKIENKIENNNDNNDDINDTSEDNNI
ncbi:tetratricopeptide repeat protein [uncultured Tyzzerella sp.]|uniref:tetratricopeptide repeat protein n=1 Tax=uncultured Tyzzerella sp. TaxID=2321398 RepID=UPI002942980E|nr:tetratricopeptide repeat protein [uncultured Tyzzerella sp.]